MSTTVARKTLRPDSKGRITLGKLAAGASSFQAYRDERGRIVLEPQVEVPAAEAWLWRDPAAIRAVKEGLRDSAAGRVVKRGTFARYAREKDE